MNYWYRFNACALLLIMVAIMTSQEVLAEDCSLFFKKVHDGELSVEQLSSRQSCINQLSDDGKTALYIATDNNDAKMVKTLIALGADVNKKSKNVINYTPVLLAGAQGENEALKVLLKQDNLDFTITNFYGGDPLIPAAEKGHVETVEILLADKRINPNFVNRLGWTALLEVTALGSDSDVYQKITKMLLNNGANPLLKDNKGISSLAYARQRGLSAVAQIIEEHGHGG